MRDKQMSPRKRAFLRQQTARSVAKTSLTGRSKSYVKDVSLAELKFMENTKEEEDDEVQGE